MPRMELGLLGGFRARLSPGDVLVLPTRKAQAVLAYLAVPAGATHPRDKIAALLWGDMSQKQSRGNLRQVLAALRRALGSTGALRLEGESIALDPARISVDVARFEACAAADDPGTLAEAARLYEGDFLAGLTLQEPPFEEWLLGQRERLRETAMDVVARLLAHQRRAGDLEAAVQSALKLLTLDPLQEPVHRTLMRLYVQLGRRGAALRQYQSCVTALDRELRTQPEPETKALYQQILTERPAPPAAIADPQAAGRLTTPSPTTPAVAAGSRPLDIPATDIPLVGREREMARLTELLEAAWSGRGQLVALLGDPGVGKSRLAAEIVALAARRGARILVGRCFESEQRLPFGVWVDALRRGDVLAGEALMGALGSVWRGELARLLPELGEPLPASREGSDPLHLFEAITRLVEQLAAREPVVILFEDAHWVDEMSLRLLSFMARRIGGWRVLWLGTLREEEVASDPRHRRMGDELAREGLAIRLHLPPLSRSDTIALGRQLLPPGTAESVDEQVWRASEGNAFIAVETARALADARRDERLPGELVPGRVRELVDGRLARLSPRSRRIVDLAATIGRQFEFSLLERASGIAEDEAAEAMEELVRRRIIQQSGDGFEFTHDRVREVAYAGLLLPQRGILHRRVAEALEALHGPGDPDAAAALAFHYREARAWPRAVHHLGRFAEQAARGYAHGDAAEALGHALDALAHTPASPERDREELRLALRRAQSLYFVGHWPESVEVLVARSALLVRVDDPSLSGPWHAWLGNIHVRLGQLEQARDSARRAIEEAARAGDDATSGKAHGVLSFAAFWGGRPREGVALGERAAALLETTAERWWEAMAHFYTAFNDGQLGRLARARASLARLRAIGEAIADNRLCNYAAWTTGWTEALEGRQAAAVGSCERALELATDPVSAAYAAAFLGYAYLESGDADRAAPRLAQAVGDYQTFRFRPAEAWFGALLADARRLQGRHDEAAAVAMRAGAVARDLGFPFAGALAQRALGRALWARGAKDDADRMLAEAAQTFRAIEAELEAARTLLDLAAVAAARDDVARARTLARSARSAFIQLDVPVHVARADEALARLV